MKNYLMYHNKKFEISEETAKELAAILNSDGKTKLCEMAEGETFKIGEWEFIILEQLDGTTAVILKDLLAKSAQFGNDNNYNGSFVDNQCNKFAEKLATVIGEENICKFDVDLTAANGMKCYGTVERNAALPTLAQVQKYAHILSEHNVDKWFWLATPNGTKEWGNTDWVFCVSPSGSINCDSYISGNGVRPFCILKSNIFVSKNV